MTSIEIRKLIEAKQAEISKCKEEMRELNLQYKDALQIEFEREHSVKSGEKIEKIIWVASPYTAVSAWLQFRF